MLGTMSSSIDYIRSGSLRALAVTTVTRSEILPDIPTVGEFVPGYEASIWLGIATPKETPVEIIDRLNREINAFLADGPRLFLSPRTGTSRAGASKSPSSRRATELLRPLATATMSKPAG